MLLTLTEYMNLYLETSYVPIYPWYYKKDTNIFFPNENNDERSLKSYISYYIIIYLQITYLGTIGGESIPECTRRILKCAIRHEIALKFSWKGKGDKKSFEGSNLCNAVKCKYKYLL